MVTVGYYYQFLGEDSAELIRFEWHPERGTAGYPHLHIHGRSADRIITDRTHIPSGRVSLASVVRFAIEELGVRPLRPDWATVLAKEERTLPLDSGG